MPLPTLTNWMPTAHSLHKAAQLLGAIRLLTNRPVSNYLELALKILPHGLSTDTLPNGGELVLDFQQAGLVFQPDHGPAVSLPLATHSQASLLEALLAALQPYELTEALAPSKGQTLTDRLLAALQATGHIFTPRREDLADSAPLLLDKQVAADYATVLYTIFTAVARFRARLVGPLTPVVVWPEHFDLSFLWFATATFEENGPLMNFGFAPFSTGIERPYLYAYVYPYPETFDYPALPTLAQWHTEGWRGVLLSYDDLIQQANPEAFVEQFCIRLYPILLTLIPQP